MDKRKIAMYVVSALVGLFIFFNLFRKERYVNKLECEIVADEVKGIVLERSDAHYQSYYIDSNKKWYTVSFPLSDTCFVIQPGDSIIKEANSKIILVKRGNLQCISRVICGN